MLEIKTSVILEQDLQLINTESIHRNDLWNSAVVWKSS